MRHRLGPWVYVHQFMVSPQIYDSCVSPNLLIHSCGKWCQRERTPQDAPCTHHRVEIPIASESIRPDGQAISGICRN